MMVIAGGGDQQCAALGVGAITPDIVSIGLGTASALSITLDKPILDERMEIPCCCAAAPGKWEFEPPIWTTGALLRWFRDNLGTKEIEEARKRGIDPYEVMTKEAESVPPGAEGLITLPYFMGAGAPNWNSQARGAIIGLTLGHNRAHIIRSLMESVAYEISLNIEAIEELGNEIKEIALSGGGSRSTLWQKIICDVTGKEINLPSIEDAPSLGVAMLASVGVGLYPDLKTAGENMTSVRGKVYPDEDRRKGYNRLLKVYKTAYSGLLDTFSKFNQL